MKCVYESNITIKPSMCDFTGCLGFANAFGLFMDIATDHAEALGCGMNALMPRDLFWLTVRAKVRFLRRPRMTEAVRVLTWPEPPERSRCNRDYAIEAGGEVLAEGKTEWMVMNLRTGRLQPTDTVLSPDLEIDGRRVLPEPFMRISEDFSDAEAVGSYTVRSTDIDIGGHMNNAAYIRALAGMFSTDTWRALDARELEVSYRRPCYEGQALALLRRQGPEGLELAFARDGKAVFLARVK